MLPAVSLAHINRFIGPEYAGLKVIEAVSVDVLPEFTKLVPGPFKVHWLLDTLVELLTGPSNWVPSSLAKKMLEKST